MPHTEQAARDVVSTGRLAVMVAVTLAILKFWAYTETGSTAVLSSLFDSAGDVVVSLMTWACGSIRPFMPDIKFRPITIQ
jgi:divalent metal cation (Fe/Co/Zn/Cd) transporter